MEKSKKKLKKNRDLFLKCALTSASPTRTTSIKFPFVLQVAALMTAIHTIHKDKRIRTFQEKRKKAAEHRKKMQKLEIQEKFRHKEAKKKIYKALSKGDKKKNAKHNS